VNAKVCNMKRVSEFERPTQRRAADMKTKRSRWERRLASCSLYDLNCAGDGGGSVAHARSSGH
jgi:hypothetical protein